MEKTLLALGFLVIMGAIIQLQMPSQEFGIKAKFNQFKTKYSKQYTSEEELYRFNVYQQTMAQIDEQNQKYGAKIFGETQFADLSDEEFQQTYLTLQVRDELNEPRIRYPQLKDELVDWRDKGAVTPIKDQGKCGSCWTFSTTGMLEAYFFVNTGVLPSLSEQQLKDCSTYYDLNFGCNGGMPSRALNYVKRNGLSTEDEYPYEILQGDCRKDGGTYFVKGHQYIDASDEGMVGALQIQTVSVGVDASNWKNYAPDTELIFPCQPGQDTLNHAVLAVAVTQDSYVIKNSWGPNWGKNGYIHLGRGASSCGVWNNMVIPL